MSEPTGDHYKDHMIIRKQNAEIARLRDIISPGNAAAYEEGMAALEAKLAEAQAQLREALSVHSAEMLRVEREWADRLSGLGEIIKRVAAQPCEQFTDGVRDCENTGREPCSPCTARAALRGGGE